MNNDNGPINFQIGLNNRQLQADADRSREILRGIGNAAVTEGNRMESAIGSSLAMIGAAAGIASIGALGKSIIAVRGEFQQLGIAFETMLGSKDKADKLMQEAVVFAQATPFTLTDVASNIKQLMAMGIATDKVMGTMKALGDVAAGVSVPISRVAINYGQVAVLGKLQERELRDFAMAGIPLAAELAKNLGKVPEEITAMITAGQISFPMVENAFKTMSSQGGMFYDLMQKQNASVTGQMSNLSDKWQVMLNDIGKSNEGLIYGGISGLTSMIANYKEIGEVVTGLISIYGLYRLATMAVAGMKATEIAVIEAKKLALTEEAIAQDAATAAAVKTSLAEKEATDLMLSNEAERAAANAVTMAAKDASMVLTADLIALERAYAITVEETNAAVLAGTMTATEQQIILQTELKGVEEARIAAKKANAIVEKEITAESVINTRITTEAVVAGETAAEVARLQGVAVQRELALATVETTGAEIMATKAKELGAAAQKLLNATMLNNPYVLMAAAIGAICYGLYKWYNYQSDLTKAINKSNGEIDIEKDKAIELFAELNHAAKGTDAWKKAKDAILSQYGDYLTEQQKELIGTKNQSEAQDAVNKGIEENIRLKVKNEALGDIIQKYDPRITAAVTNVKEAVKGSLGADRAANVGQEIAPLIANIKLSIDPEARKKAEDDFDVYMRKLQEEVTKKSSIWSTSVGKIGEARGEAERALEGWKDETLAATTAFNVAEKAAATTVKKDTFITADQQRLQLRKDLVSAEKELVSLQTKEYKVGVDKAPLTAISDQEAKIKGLKEQLGISDKNVAKEKKSAQEIADAKLKVTNDEIKSGLELQSAAQENQQALLNIKEDGFLKSQEQLKLNGEKEKTAEAKITQQLIEEQQKLERDKWDQSGKIGVFTPATKTASDLTPENKKRLTDQTDTYGIVSTAQSAKLIKDLLDQYQDFTAKKEAIDKKYNADLLALQSLPEGEGKNKAIAKLEEDWKNASSKLSLEDFQKSIDWAAIFGDLDNVSTTALNEFRAKVKQYLSSAGNSISKEDLKTVTESFNKLNDAISNRTPIKELISGYNDYKDACVKVAEAQSYLNDLTKFGGATTQDLADATANLTDAEKKKKESLTRISKDVEDVANKGQQLIGASRDVVSALGDLGISVDKNVSKALDGAGQMLDGASTFAKGMATGDVVSMISGGVKALAGVISVGTALFGDGSKVLSQGVIDYYDDLMATMKDVIAVHKALIAEFSGSAAVSEAEKATELINKQIEATRKLGLEYLDSRAAHSHSVGHNLQVSLDEYKSQLAAIGVNFSDSNGGIGQLFTMTPAQLEQIKEEVPGAWAKIDDQTRAYLQTIIDSKGAIDDTTKALGKALTDLSFDDAKSSLKSLLLSADTTMADIADNFEQYMRNAIVNALIAGQLDPLMKQWYVDFTTAMSDGILTDKEKTDLQAEYTAIGQTGINLRDNAYKAIGLDPASTSSTATSGKISASITEDTANELVGLWNRTALDIRETLNLSKASSGYLLNIAANTLRTADNTDRLSAMEISLKSIDQAVTKTASRF